MKIEINHKIKQEIPNWELKKHTNGEQEDGSGVKGLMCRHEDLCLNPAGHGKGEQCVLRQD